MTSTLRYCNVTSCTHYLLDSTSPCSLQVFISWWNKLILFQINSIKYITSTNILLHENCTVKSLCWNDMRKTKGEKNQQEVWGKQNKLYACKHELSHGLQFLWSYHERETSMYCSQNYYTKDTTQGKPDLLSPSISLPTFSMQKMAFLHLLDTVSSSSWSP